MNDLFIKAHNRPFIIMDYHVYAIGPEGELKDSNVSPADLYRVGQVIDETKAMDIARNSSDAYKSWISS